MTAAERQREFAGGYELQLSYRSHFDVSTLFDWWEPISICTRSVHATAMWNTACQPAKLVTVK